MTYGNIHLLKEVDLWNCLPTCVVKNQSVDSFKRNYKQVLV